MNSKRTLEKFELVAQYLKSNEDSIIKQFNSIPNARWKKNDNGFSIFINDKMPISDIKLSFLSDKPAWVSLDENYNGLADENELKFFPSKDNYIYIPVTIYSNRLKVTNKKVRMHSQFDIETANTKFNIITENNIIPNTVVATNPFSQKSFVIKNEGIFRRGWL